MSYKYIRYFTINNYSISISIFFINLLDDIVVSVNIVQSNVFALKGAINFFRGTLPTLGMSSALCQN